MLDLFKLNGKNILVTGASSGIGQATAIECSNLGARLFISGRNVDRLNKTFNELKPVADEQHLLASLDLGEQKNIDLLVDLVPKLDGVVHCAGIHGIAPMHLVRRDFIDSVMNANYIMPIMLTKQLLMKKKIKKFGSIVFMSSIAAEAGTPGVGPYSASKAALIGLMRPLALEIAKHGIRVNSICPGLVDTPILNGQEKSFAAMTRDYPLGGGETIDVANACIFFLADASKKVTGTVFNIDGGVVIA